MDTPDKYFYLLTEESQTHKELSNSLNKALDLVEFIRLVLEMDVQKPW